MKEKVLVGIGCSWTQGEGGYTEETWKKYNGKINLPMGDSVHLIPMEQEHSWVNVLCRDYLIDHKPINLGQRGVGNRGAAKSLYLANVDWDNVEGYVVMMLSGFERFDFFQPQWKTNVATPLKDAGHYNFQTLWPHTGNCPQWDAYAEHIYSEAGTAAEQFANIMEVQTFCQAHGLKFILANAFDGRGQEFIREHCGALADKIDWSRYVHTNTSYKSFVELLVEKDGLIPKQDWGSYWEVYRKLKYPAKYLANCIHPTIEGYRVIAQELFNFISTVR